MNKLLSFLAEKEFNITPVLDGSVQRFDREGEISGWFVGSEVTLSSGRRVITAKCGDWKSGEKYEYKEESADYDETEIAEAKLATREAERKLAAEQKRIHAEVAVLSEKLWSACHGPNGHSSPYLERKKIDGLFGARTLTTDEYITFMRRETGREVNAPSGQINVCVPCRDADGKLHGIQKIHPDGAKMFFPGQRIQGVFHTVGPELTGTGTAYLCEGFATAISVHLATGKSTLACFNAGNLIHVGRAVRAQYPDLEIVFAGDDDRHTVLKRTGKPSNAGREYGEEAARAIGARILFPVFRTYTPDIRPTDWNDLQLLEGIEVVRAQFEEAEAVAREARATGLAVVPGKMSAAQHQPVANALLSYYGTRIRKQGKDLFIYTGTHWKWVDLDHQHRMMGQLQTLFGGRADYPALAKAYNLFLIGVKPVPEGTSLFSPPPWLANFHNGTLHVVKRDGKYSTRFAAHDPSDWTINVLPYDYRPEDKTVNTEFMAMLDRVFQGDSDKDQKIRAIRQMYGACLIPAFPHLFMLWGPPGTGKSTAIILAAKLMHADNCCSVDPTDFKEFNMETMAGKLVNFDTDIEMHNPISEKQIKKIIDRLPFRIRRKTIVDIYAPIPAVHIFGGNNIPKTLDGASKAHDRRWTFIGFNAFVPSGDYDTDYATYCFEKSPQGILNFALEGLADLLALRGHFTVPESGKEKMAEWQLETDIIGRFLADLKAGDVLDDKTNLKPVFEGVEPRVTKVKMWELFLAWGQLSTTEKFKMERNKFYASLSARGIKTVKVKGSYCFTGFAISTGEDSSY